ncbi:MAG: FxsA family protein [Acidimicrobiales bacterium]
MFRFLVIAFIIVPIIEIYLIVQVDAAIGGWETLGLLVFDSVVGAWLVRREGFSILANVRGSLSRGEAPTNDLIDGMLVLFAGALMLTPGFLTDGLGFLLLLPPTRAVVRNTLKSRFTGSIKVAGFGPAGFGRRPWTTVDSDIVDGSPVDGSTVDDDDDDPPGSIELGPISD